ncbi:SRPBCC family protein [Devosia sp. Root105]|uniref:SRPBCC family protein n=1 Tax=Devosia sp. Root105 TaxID=1736423 RepID=UPI0007001C6C|nr:SRPBCC family protein [Devosia sp. Root105]KQU99394.1 ATPase [Devosia sp. Root105]
MTEHLRIDTASRIIAAPPKAIYRAFVDRDALLAWLPPEGMTGEMLEFEPRPGGAFRMALHYSVPGPGKTTEDTDMVESEFAELVPGHRVVQLVRFRSDDPAFAGTMRMVWDLEPADGGTRVIILAEDVPPGISKEDHDTGLRSSLENLARYVEGNAR